MRASDLQSNFLHPLKDNHQVAQAKSPSADPSAPPPPHAGGESIEESGFELDEFTPDPPNLSHGGE